MSFKHILKIMNTFTSDFNPQLDKLYDIFPSVQLNNHPFQLELILFVAFVINFISNVWHL